MPLNLLSARSGRTIPRFQRAALLQTVRSCASALLLLAGGCLTTAAWGQGAGGTIETLLPDAFAYASDAGPMPGSQRLTVTVTLAQTAERGAALDEFLKDVSTASSPRYRKWVTPAEFASEYGATAEQREAATTWATSFGLTVEEVSPGGMRMVVSGFRAQMEAAFGVKLRQFMILQQTYFANTADVTLREAGAGLFTSVEGLDDFPADLTLYATGPTGVPATHVNEVARSLSIASLASLVDENKTAVLRLDSTFGAGTPAASRVAGLAALFRQASAQGITTLLTRTASSGGFPSGLVDITAVVQVGDIADFYPRVALRPKWQVAEGLPQDGMRQVPDLTAASASGLAATLSAIASTVPGGRLGNVNPVLYELAKAEGLYTQPDDAKPGTWEPATGLGLVDLSALRKFFPRGQGGSFASFSASNYSPVHGQNVTFKSTVTSGTGGATPTGTVSFATTGGTVIGAATLDATGTATYTTNQLDGGNYTVQANYSGDGSYAGAASPSGTVFVQPEAAQLTVSVSHNNTVGGTYNVGVTDAAASGVGTPTGNITLTLSGTGTTYTQALVANGANSGATTFTVPATTVGTLTLAVNCTSSANYSCYNAVTTTVTVAKATPKLTYTFSPNPPKSGQSIALAATVAGNGTAPSPTGSVTFYDNTTVLNAGTLSNGSTSASGTVPTTATHSITATYSGDANYSGVSASGGTSSSGTASTTTSLISSASSVSAGQSFNLTVTVTPAKVVNSSSPSGTVQILDGTAVIATSPALSNGMAVVPLSLTGASTHSLTAFYPGDANYGASTSGAVAVVVTGTLGAASTSTIITSSSYAVSYGQSFTLTAGVTPASTVHNAAPTGTVTFTGANGTVTGTANLNANLASLLVTTPIAPGSYSFTANYNGDANYAASTSAASAPVAVATATGTVTATINPVSVGTAASATVSATVTLANSSVPPTPGTITVTVPGVPGGVYTGTMIQTGVNAGSVNIAVPAPPAGTYLLAVTCGTSANYMCNTATVSLTSTAVVKIATTTVLTLAPSAPTAGQAITLTASVSSATTGAAAISGTVLFFDGATQIGMAPVTAGVATATTALTGTSVHNLTAVYSGDTNYLASTSIAVPVTLALTPTAVVLSASATAGLQGNNITLTAQVSGVTAAGLTPTGIVKFYLSGVTPSLLGSATLIPSTPGLAVATFNTNVIPAGTQTVYAVYPGDTNFAAGTSSLVSVGLTDYALAFTPNSVVLSPGQTASVAVTINTTPGFNGSITVGCVPPANALITCSFSTVTLTGPGTSVLTIVTEASARASNRMPPLTLLGGGSVAGLFGLLVPRLRRRRVPSMLMVLLATGLTLSVMSITGCSGSTVASGSGTGGTPLGTVNLTIDTAGSNGSQSVSHDYTYQVTVQ